MPKKLTLKDIEKELVNLSIEYALNYLYDLQNSSGLNLGKLIEKYLKKKAVKDKETERFNEMCKFEKDAVMQGFRCIAGVDEAGRGPLAGPVVAASVILPEGIFIEHLNDSKQVNPKQRDLLFDIIKEKAIAFSVGIVDEKCIDEINILNATKKAMELAIGSLKPQPDLILIDAVSLDGIKTPQIPIIKGDSLSISIAAASIIAKVTRDRLIDSMDSEYPVYGFSKHKGYGTKEHIDAIKKYGICPIHRISFTKNFVS